MCGIVGAVAERNVTPILLEGLRRLEYRGYDSAGIAVLDEDGCISRVRRVGKVKELSEALKETEVRGSLGVAHTRWATHGEPSEKNAHPHICNQSVVIVHTVSSRIMVSFAANRVKQVSTLLPRPTPRLPFTR